VKLIPGKLYRSGPDYHMKVYGAGKNGIYLWPGTIFMYLGEVGTTESYSSLGVHEILVRDKVFKTASTQIAKAGVERLTKSCLEDSP